MGEGGGGRDLTNRTIRQRILIQDSDPGKYTHKNIVDYFMPSNLAD